MNGAMTVEFTLDLACGHVETTEVFYRTNPDTNRLVRMQPAPPPRHVRCQETAQFVGTGPTDAGEAAIRAGWSVDSSLFGTASRSDLCPAHSRSGAAGWLYQARRWWE